jgi:diguanylate cyclase (GGDEF)-like protein/PAS domain S-box-containing protein
VDPRRWWLLAAAVPLALACALATAQPALRLTGQLAIVAAGLLAAGLIWRSAERTPRPNAWRLLSVAALLPVVGVLLTLAAGPVADPLTVAVLRWAPTVPGYVVAIVAVLGLVQRRRLRAGPRVAVEVTLFFLASLIVVGLLLVGPADNWEAFGLAERFVLGSAIIATSATMAAALTLLGVIEADRRAMAVALLGGTVLLTLGRGLATSALLSGTPPVPAGVARLLIAAGLLLLALAVLLDSVDAPVAGPATWRGGEIVPLLPYLALLIASVTVGSAVVAEIRLDPLAFLFLVACVLLSGVHRWLTAREEQRLGARLRRSEAYFRSVVQSAGDAVVILDDALRVSWASPALERSLGETAADLTGRPILESVHPDDAPALAAVLEGDSDPLGSGLLTLRLPDAAGEWRYLEAGVSDLRHDSDVGAVVLHCRDMTDRHAREQALQSVAYTDPMTGLPNRAGVVQTLEARLSDDGRGPSTLLFIALDGLDLARENAGRENVTAVVAEIGRRLRATVRGEDLVARMGGGAFAVLTHGADEDAERLAARCLSVVEQPILTPVGLIELTAAVGLVPLDEGIDVDALLERADLAVRAAHEAGKGCVARYSPALGEAAARRERLRTDLQGACARGEMYLLVQPIVSLAEERITGMEAQLHWRHPDLGEIAPAEFLELAERSGLIGQVIRWALEEATTLTAGLPSNGAPLRVGFKVPAGYAATGTLVADVEHALTLSGLAPERLVLQVSSETATAGDERTGLDITSLRLMGVHVALDGFGSGSSALAHLTQLPIDVVRLDRSLITRIDRDPQSRALCESIAGIALALNLDVVAEGVETPAQLAALAGFGCGFAQGFLISRPVRAAQLAAMLAEDAAPLLPAFVSRV